MRTIYTDGKPRSTRVMKPVGYKCCYCGKRFMSFGMWSQHEEHCALKPKEDEQF